MNGLMAFGDKDMGGGFLAPDLCRYGCLDGACGEGQKDIAWLLASSRARPLPQILAGAESLYGLWGSTCLVLPELAPSPASQLPQVRRLACTLHRIY